MKGIAWFTVALLLFVGCGSPQPKTDTDKDAFNKETEAAIERLKGKDPGIKEWFSEKSYGYAVFPAVGKGGLVVGGAHGRGQVYEQGKHIGYADLKQGTVGFQAGGQSFIEVIFFEDEAALKAFKASEWEMGAHVSAVAVSKGASSAADYTKGICVFTLASGGLMAEAAVGGQKFKYVKK